MIDEAPIADDIIVHVCFMSCRKVVREIEKLKRRLATEGEGVQKQKLLKIFTFRS